MSRLFKRGTARAVFVVAAGGLSLIAGHGLRSAHATVIESPSFTSLPSILVKGEGRPVALSSTELQDVSTFAEQNDVSIADATRIAAGQVDWDEVIARLRKAIPSQFVNAGRTPQDGSAWITLTEAPSDATRALVATLPFNVSVRYGAPASYDQLHDLAEKARVAVSAVPGVLGAGGGVDAETGKVVITVYGKDILDSVVRDAVKSAVPQLPVALVLKHEDEISIRVAYTGGAQLSKNVSGQPFECTSGFNVNKYSTGETGTLTAAHCYDYLLYGEGNVAGVISFVPPEGAGKVDAQYHRSLSGSVAAPDFHATSNAQGGKRSVNTAYPPQAGDMVCKWGYGYANHTGSLPAYACAYVTTNVDQTVATNNSAWGHTDELNKQIYDPGDSGGPNFLGNTAYGLTEGYGKTTCYFTIISNATQSLSVSTMTQGD